jgi:uncharacterized protein (DUF2225 family)
MTRDDWCECPNCHFPALESYFRNVIENTGSCLMCYFNLTINEIIPKTNAVVKKSITRTTSIDLESSNVNTRVSEPSLGGLAI